MNHPGLAPSPDPPMPHGHWGNWMQSKIGKPKEQNNDPPWQLFASLAAMKKCLQEYFHEIN
jgi:hypothetical protein